jgi:hypothetical protein
VPAPLIDRELLEKLERLTIHWQKSLPGLVGGHNTSRFAGAGQEFLDHRHFHQGDDLRAVNWRAYLRLEKLFLKMFQLEPRIPVRILLDVSKSMETGKVAKFDYARKLAAAMCYVGFSRRFGPKKIGSRHGMANWSSKTRKPASTSSWRSIPARARNTRRRSTSTPSTFDT